MSTYGTVLAVDYGLGKTPIADQLVELASGNADIYVEPRDECVRVTAHLGVVEVQPALIEVFTAVAPCRAAIAEDLDEFGASWVVLHCREDRTEVIHRRYLLNADPDDDEAVSLAIAALGSDPRTLDVAGPDAARAAAVLFGTDPSRMEQAETASAAAWQEIGIVGGPFRWWDALDLTWPGESAD